MTNYYETVRDMVANVRIQVELQNTYRGIEWFDEETGLGITTNPYGTLEIFMKCSELPITQPLLTQRLEYSKWRPTETGDSFSANRLTLPPGPEFDPVAAFICTLLLENEFQKDPIKAFQKSESTISLLFRRKPFTDEALTGLLGELVLLRELIRGRHELGKDLLDIWTGYDRSLRDISIGSVGIEVKTTRTQHSHHHIQGTHQIELRHTPQEDGTIEDFLRLVSIGIVEVSESQNNTDNSFTLTDLVEEISRLIAFSDENKRTESKIRDDLVLLINRYGAAHDSLLTFNTIERLKFFDRSWELAFARSYDMTDPRLEVIRSNDLLDFQMVDSGSLSYTMKLPSCLGSEDDPISGLNDIAQDILKRAKML
jgi:hypothetical protein